MSGAGSVSLCKVVSGLGIGCIIFTTVIKLSLTRSWTRAEADDSLSLGPFCSLLVLQETSTACVPKGQREKEIHTSLLFPDSLLLFFLVFCFPGPFLQFPYLQLDPSLTHPLCFVTQRPQFTFLLHLGQIYPINHTHRMEHMNNGQTKKLSMDPAEKREYFLLSPRTTAHFHYGRRREGSKRPNTPRSNFSPHATITLHSSDRATDPVDSPRPVAPSRAYRPRPLHPRLVHRLRAHSPLFPGRPRPLEPL